MTIPKWFIWLLGFTLIPAISFGGLITIKTYTSESRILRLEEDKEATRAYIDRQTESITQLRIQIERLADVCNRLESVEQILHKGK